MRYPSQNELKEIFEYRDGELYWKKSNGTKITIGKLAGSLSKDSGYIFIRMGKLYRAHRLIWIYHYGDIPESLQIDHINRIRNDNRIENLRIVSQSLNIMNQNRKNIRVKKCIDGRLSYNAYYVIDGKQYSKSFNTEQEAAIWVNQKKSEIFQEKGLTWQVDAI
jgi:hypothetical protein